MHPKSLSVVILLLCSFIYSADQPQTEDITLKFVNEPATIGLRITSNILSQSPVFKNLPIVHGEEQPELRISRKVLLTFPYFETMLRTGIGVKQNNILEINSNDMPSGAIQFFTDIIQVVLKSYTDVNIFFKQLEKIPYVIPSGVAKELSDIFLHYEISPQSYNDLYNLAKYLYNEESKMALIIAWKAVSVFSDEPPQEAITLDPELDMMLSKMLIYDAITTTSQSYDQMPLSYIPELGNTEEFKGLQTDYTLYFVPTAIQKTFGLIYSKSLSKNFPSIIIIQSLSGNDNHTINYPIITADYKNNTLVYLINKNNQLVLCIAESIDNQPLELNSDGYIIPFVVDNQKTKIIFKSDSNSEFYVKLNNKIYLFELDKEINFYEPITIDHIEDQWNKIYLTEENPMIHTCPAIENSKNNFFNTTILHAFDFPYETEPYSLNKIYRKNVGRDISIIQCACDKENNIHYILLKKEPNIYYAIRRRFNIDQKLQKLLDFMNTQYIEKQTNQNKQLYPDALYCFHTTRNKWALTPTQLNAKMGVLSDQVSNILKDQIPTPNIPTRLKHTISTQLQPIINRYVRQLKTPFGYFWTGLKYGLQTGALAMSFLYISSKLPKDLKYQTPVLGIGGYLLYKQFKRLP
jgi:hypothetical protein